MNGGSFMKVTFDEIYDNYHQDLYRFIFYMVKDKQVTEDLVQEVYIKILKSQSSFKGDSSQKTWLFSIARYTTIDYFRSKKRMKERILEFFDWGEKGELLKDNQPLPEELLIEDEQMQLVYQYLDKCSADQRSVLILRFIQSFSIRETADILNFSESKVKTVQHRGLRVIKKHLLRSETIEEAYDEK